MSRRCLDGCPAAALPTAARPAASLGQPPRPGTPRRHPRYLAGRRAGSRRRRGGAGRAASPPCWADPRWLCRRHRGGAWAGRRPGRGGRHVVQPRPRRSGEGGPAAGPHSAGPLPHISVSDSTFSVQSSFGPGHPRFGSHRRRHGRLAPGTLGSGRTSLVQSDTGLGILRAGTPASDRTPPVPVFSVLGILSPGLYHFITPWFK